MPFKKDFHELGIVDRLNAIEMKENRDQSFCSSCGTAKNLTIHHVDQNPLKTYDKENIMILCKDCHKKIHAKEKPKKHYAQINKFCLGG